MNHLTRKAEDLFVDPTVILEARPDGSRLFSSAHPLPATYARCTGEWLERWAKEGADRVFLA